ncbi:hypothetical protein ANCCEY_07633 [Ancylostoma ceylanicum]|uniref:ERAP1-like C-terminal domain-containing protein n=1 Tax=Ancylostoma ceylanicum TaxID=53326 RepID=A0A0D6LPZ9_9BILA|nr:hypothetical protein ANCCEY_07633 [Ancylostoma ceylanicum]
MIYLKIYSAQTRSGLISDAFAAAQIDRLDYETVFQLLEYLPKEKSDLVWHMVKNGLASIVDFYGNEPDGEWAMKRKATMRRNHTAKETLDKNEKLFVTTANLSALKYISTKATSTLHAKYSKLSLSVADVGDPPLLSPVIAAQGAITGDSGVRPLSQGDTVACDTDRRSHRSVHYLEDL